LSFATSMRTLLVESTYALNFKLEVSIIRPYSARIAFLEQLVIMFLSFARLNNKHFLSSLINTFP